MRKFLPFIACVISMQYTVAQTNYPGGISGCIGRWDFANSGNPISALPDVSGNGNNATTINNLSTATGFRGVINKAMTFNGFNGYASIPNSSTLNPTAITMVAVVKMNGFYGGPCQTSEILSKGYPNFVAGNYGMGFSDNVYDNGNCSAFSPTHQQLGAQFGPTSASPSPTAGNYVTTGQWYFVATSYDGVSSVKYYQVIMDPAAYVSNVTPIYTLTGSGSIGGNTQALSIGRHLNPSYPYLFNGSMDEVAVFNRALTTTEIQSVYDYLWGIVKITSLSSTNLCDGQSFTVNYSVNNSSFFSTSNTFTVQLSNASGSFASPVNVGNVTATSGGTITCTVPAGTATGTGYRIRIIGSDVAYTTTDNGTNISITSIAKPDATSNSPVCQGQTLTLSGTCATPGVTFNWNGPGLSTSQQNVTISPATMLNAGTYTLTASLNGCTSKADTEVVAIGSSQTPTITSYISPNDTLCISNTTVAFQALITNGGSNPQFQWQRNGSPIPGATTSTFFTTQLTNGDVINCKLSTNGCATINTVTSNSFTITILPQAAVGVTMAANPSTPLSPWQTVTFTASVTNGGSNPSFQWKRNGSDIQGATADTWSTNNLSDNDTITVAVTSSSPCAKPASATSQAVIVKIKTGIDDVDKSNSIRLYPNPNKGTFTIQSRFTNNKAITIEVLNVAGQVVFKDNAMPKNNVVNKEVSLGADVPFGVYMLKLTSGETYKTIRFSIEK